MNIPKAFWIGLVIFQIAFGTAIFMVTRSYYEGQNQVVALPSLNAPVQPLPMRRSDTPPAIDATQPQTPQELASLADAHFENRQYDAAVVLYERLLEFDRMNVDTLNNLALTLHYIGRSDEALRRIEDGISIDGTHQRILLTKGFVLVQTGRRSEAIEPLNRAIELSQDGAVADSARRMLADAASR